MAKLAPKYVGPYEILENKGSNTYSLIVREGNTEELVHAEYLKPYFEGKEPEEKYDELQPDMTRADTQPTLDTEEMAMSDPPEISEPPPAGADQAQDGASDTILPRGRGRPRKNVRIVIKPPVNIPPSLAPCLLRANLRSDREAVQKALKTARYPANRSLFPLGKRERTLTLSPETNLFLFLFPLSTVRRWIQANLATNNCLIWSASC